MPEYTTLSQTMDALRREGYTEDFNLQPDCLECSRNGQKIAPHEFVIDKTFRFEGESNPDDEAVLYAISGDDHRLKGLLVNGYGISSDGVADEMMRKLQLQ